MRLTRSLVPVLVAAAGLAAPPALTPPAQAAAVTCGGVKATIIGNAKANTITGTARRDVIVARGGNDTIRGLGGNDLICAGDGADTIRRGQGFRHRAWSRGQRHLQGGGEALELLTRGESRGDSP